MWAAGGILKVVFDFMIDDGKIVVIDMPADPERLDELDVMILT